MPGLLGSLFILGLSLWHLVAPHPLPPLTGEVDRILVDKSDRRLSLIQDGRVVRAYTVSLGFAPEGDKDREGDGRTPEGTFRIDRRNDASRFHLSLGIDYPQREDRARAAKGGYSPGGDIFIHGQPNGWDGRVEGDWTDGCIALSNREIEALWRAVALGTEVEILP